MRLFFFCALCMVTWSFAGDGPRDWNFETDAPKEADPEFQRNSLLPTTPWLDSVRSGDIVYFLYDDPARIERYDLVGSAWLGEIVLAEAPMTFDVDSDGIYVAFNRRVSRFSLDGSSETHLANTVSTIHDIVLASEYLMVAANRDYLSIDKLTGGIHRSYSGHYRLGGLSYAPSQQRVYGRSIGVSPSDIFYMNFYDDGGIEVQYGSPYHGAYPSASKTYLFPNELKVVDNSGIVYLTSDLTYNNSFGGSFDDLRFHEDLPVLLRDATFYSFSNTLLETGSHGVENLPLTFEIHGSEIVYFYESETKIVADSFSLDLLTPAEPGEPINPVGLDYEYDKILQAADGDLFLLSRAHFSVFRYSASGYVDSIPLNNAPIDMAYSSETNTLYFAYDGGSITRIELDLGNVEEPFVNSPQTPQGIATAGAYLFVVDPSGAWYSHFTYDPDGTLISQVDWNRYSRVYTWSPSLRRMFFFRDGTSPNDLHWEEINEDGEIGREGETPYHGGFWYKPPLTLIENEASVLIGSGVIFETATLNQTNALSNDVDDALWFNDQLVTAVDTDEGVTLQEWGPNYGVESTYTFHGDHPKLFKWGSEIMVVTLYNGRPKFNVLTTCVKEGGYMTRLESWPNMSISQIMTECAL